MTARADVLQHSPNDVQLNSMRENVVEILYSYRYHVTDDKQQLSEPMPISYCVSTHVDVKMWAQIRTW